MKVYKPTTNTSHCTIAPMMFATNDESCQDEFNHMVIMCSNKSNWPPIHVQVLLLLAWNFSFIIILTNHHLTMHHDQQQQQQWWCERLKLSLSVSRSLARQTDNLNSHTHNYTILCSFTCLITQHYIMLCKLYNMSYNEKDLITRLRLSDGESERAREREGRY